MRNYKTKPVLLLAAGGICMAVSMTGYAQIKTIPKEGLPGLSKEALEFEIEHNYRRENNLGQTVPAEEGTKPNSTDPRVLDGIWIMGKTYSVNADGSYSEAGGMAAGAAGMAAGGAGGAPGGAPGAGGPGGAPGGAAPGGAPGGAGGMAAGGASGPAASSCGISFTVTMGMPSKIVQTDKVMYVLTNSQNSGVTFRRIEMNSSHPANLQPSVLGHSIGHWDGDTLVVETIGLKGGGGGGGGPGGAGLSLSATSKVTERIKKIDGGLKLEDVVTVEDTVTKQSSKQRIVSYYRPDLQYVEAPCEEYSDPFADAYGNPEASAKAVSEIVKKAGDK